MCSDQPPEEKVVELIGGPADGTYAQFDGEGIIVKDICEKPHLYVYDKATIHEPLVRAIYRGPYEYAPE
jgi:hypothetical protein